MTNRILSDDTYDLGDFAGVVQQTTFQVESPTGGTFYYKNPTSKGDTRTYTCILSAGVPKVVVVQKDGVFYSDALATTVVVVGKVYATHFGGN